MKTNVENSRDLKVTATIVYGLVFIWFVFAVMMAWQERYQTPPNKPPLAFGLTLLVPTLFFIIAYRQRGAIWAFCQTLDLRLVVAVHAWRLIAIDFLLCCAEHRLPPAFAIPAGVGDILTALAAIPIAFAISTGMPGLKKRFVAFNIFGLADLVLALTLGVTHSNSALGIFAASGTIAPLMVELPRSLIPTFLVPMFMLLHLLALARRNEIAATVRAN